MVLDLVKMNADYKIAYDAWISAVVAAGLDPKKAEAVGPAKTAVDLILSNWRKEVRSLSDINTNDSNALDELSRLSSQVATERDNLRQLISKQGTRIQQVGSVNPKVTESPYVNIIGLRRNFRKSTKVGLIVASGVFGVLALGLLGYIGYKAIPTQSM
jgi:hypothetical protein